MGCIKSALLYRSKSQGGAEMFGAGEREGEEAQLTRPTRWEGSRPDTQANGETSKQRESNEGGR